MNIIMFNFKKFKKMKDIFKNAIGLTIGLAVWILYPISVAYFAQDHSFNEYLIFLKGIFLNWVTMKVMLIMYILFVILLRFIDWRTYDCNQC